jgi:hypothetical protein
MTSINILAAAASAAALALVADPACARVHHHHHQVAQTHTRHGRSQHELTADSARRHGLRGREAEKTLVSHHGRRRGAPVEVATRTADHAAHRRAALCETLMVHGRSTTHCRGETA